MKKVLFSVLTLMFSVVSHAQTDSVFKGRICSEEYGIYICMNFYEKDVLVPGQEVFGELDGYIASDKSSQVWPITSSAILSDGTAEIEVVNNYGSEDFTAILSYRDGKYTLRHVEGSALKFPVNNKWQKIPKATVLKKPAPDAR